MTKSLFDIVQDMLAHRDQLAKTVERKLKSRTRAGFFDHPDSNVVADLISVLSHPDTPVEVRREIVAGLRAVYRHVRQAFDGAETPRLTASIVGISRDLSNIIDGGDVTELKSEIASLALLACFKAVERDEVMEPLVRAAKSTLLKPDFKDLWYRLLAQPGTAALAANALIRIEQDSARIEQMLTELWERKIKEKWSVDVAYLMRIATTDNSKLSKILKKVDRTILDEVRAELDARDWSREWLVFIEKPKKARVKQQDKNADTAVPAKREPAFHGC